MKLLTPILLLFASVSVFAQNAGVDQTILLPEAATLFGSGRAPVKWSVQGTKLPHHFSDPNSTTTKFSVMVAGTYRVRITQSGGRYDEALITFKAPAPPTIDTVYTTYIGGADYYLLSNGRVQRNKGVWNNTTGLILRQPCGEKFICIYANGTWKITE